MVYFSFYHNVKGLVPEVKVSIACESLHAYTVCIWCCEHARFCVEVLYVLCINFHSFIHSFISIDGYSQVRSGQVRSVQFFMMSLWCSVSQYRGCVLVCCWCAHC